MKWLIQRINNIHDIFGMLDDFGYLKKDALFLWRYKISIVTSTYEGWEKGNGGLEKRRVVGEREESYIYI